MKITLVCAGKIKEKYLAQGIAEFTKRLTPFCRLEICEIAEEKMPDNPSPAEKEKILTAEGERLLRQVPRGSYLIVLDVVGQAISSEELSRKIDSLGLSGHGQLTFLIGGPFGLADNIRRAADERISFSRLTFTHQMIRLLLVEQLYRAFKISRGEKYHL